MYFCNERQEDTLHKYRINRHSQLAPNGKSSNQSVMAFLIRVQAKTRLLWLFGAIYLYISYLMNEPTRQTVFILLSPILGRNWYW